MNSFIKSNKGNASGVGLVLLGALAMTGLIIENQNNQITGLIQKNKVQSASDAISASNVSQLSRMRALFSYSIKSGVPNRALPRIYFSNYMNDQNAQVETNPAFGTTNEFQIDQAGQNIDLTSATSHNFATKTDVLSSAPPAPYTPPTLANIKVLRRIADPDFKFLTQYVEVQISSKDAKTGKKRVEKAWVTVDPPNAWNPSLQISSDGGATWSPFTDNTTLKQATYAFRVLADGVAVDASVLVNDSPLPAGHYIATGGPTGTKLSTSAATSIYGKGKIVGTFQANIAGTLNSVPANWTPEYWNAQRANVTDFKHGGDNCLIDTIDSPNAGQNNMSVTVRVQIWNPKFNEAVTWQDYKNVILESPPSPPAGPLDYNGTNEQFIAHCPNSCDTYGVKTVSSSTPDSWLVPFFASMYTQMKTKNYSQPLLHWGATNFVKGPYGVCTDVSIAGPEAMQYSPTDGGTTWAAMQGPSKTGDSPGDPAYDQQYLAFDYAQCQPRIVFARHDCGCFNDQTRIRLADGSDKPIAQIDYHDIVYNPITGAGYMIKKIIAGPEKLPMLIMTIEGRSVEVTQEHPFIAPHGLISAAQAQVDDLVLNAHGGYSPIEAKEAMEYAVLPTVWNIELLAGDDPGQHYVLADGVLTGDLYLQNKLKQQQSVSK